ncbi:MAG TPA: glycosyltransferase [Usitatibacter sp.]|nr:glycosyltransferase [Usitatibacter sp.]
MHIASLHGGGVDRHVRDIVRGLPRGHLVWHVSDRAEVLELPREGRSLPLDPAAVDREPEIAARFLRGHGVGILHVHSLGAAARARAAALARRVGLPFIVTLHDVLFLRPDALERDGDLAPDREWLAATSAFLRSAAAVVAPSEYIAELARRHVPGLDVAIVPNGSPPRRAVAAIPDPRPEFAARRPRAVAMVLGAIGPHKGSAMLEALGAPLAGSGIAIVVIGYLDAQVTPGWRGAHLFVHGAYGDDEVPGLVRAYGARVALFPNRAPESFSYALSDLWDAGVPALVPAAGALGERVRRHGGGWILPDDAGPAAIAAALGEHLGPAGAAGLARVESDLSRTDDARVPRLDTMTRSLDALYARFGIDAQQPLDVDAAEVQALLAKNLDGALFREELARVADELAQLRSGIAEERGQAAQFATEARAWIAKLEADVAKVQADLLREHEALGALAEENEKMRPGHEAFWLLPRFVRNHLLKKIRDARG